MSGGPTSTRRGERDGRPGTTWDTALTRTEVVVHDNTPDPEPANRATRRAQARDKRRSKQ